MKYSSISKKTVVNVVNGDILGEINDLEFNRNDFVIRNFIVKPRGKLITIICPFLFQKESVVIKTCEIVSMGSDIILVKIKQ